MLFFFRKSEKWTLKKKKLTIKNWQISLYYHFNKIIKEPETSFQDLVTKFFFKVKKWESKEITEKKIPLLVMPIMISQILKSVDFTKVQNLDIFRTKYLITRI